MEPFVAERGERFDAGGEVDRVADAAVVEVLHAEGVGVDRGVRRAGLDARREAVLGGVAPVAGPVAVGEVAPVVAGEVAGPPSRGAAGTVEDEVVAFDDGADLDGGGLYERERQRRGRGPDRAADERAGPVPDVGGVFGGVVHRCVSCGLGAGLVPAYGAEPAGPLSCAV